MNSFVYLFTILYFSLEFCHLIQKFALYILEKPLYSVSELADSPRYWATNIERASRSPKKLIKMSRDLNHSRQGSLFFFLFKHCSIAGEQELNCKEHHLFIRNYMYAAQYTMRNYTRCQVILLYQCLKTTHHSTLDKCFSILNRESQSQYRSRIILVCSRVKIH